ncbi:LysE family translocator [Microbulbifer sp. OS29]|uniref:LysE family translocator n=1 Tax=Microbulbifer okhotskensis TaxID=2926617 RepID=A0A9X2EJQ9_9GAMM|nr:LysE family translocator [Microbulbifer okhotskensis]MCO1333497.1 LysE family translocator [Microbulbifer okhotskensis]
MSEILVFAAISLLLVVSPGPNSVLILKTLTAKGLRPALENILGLVSATFAHGAISILGLSAIIVQSAEIYTLIKYLGAAYLVYLGMKTIVSTFAQSSSQASQMGGSDSNAGSRASHRNFAEGFLTQILNPKVSMFYLAALPQFIQLGSSSHYEAFILVSVHASIIFLWFLGMSSVLSRWKQISVGGRARHWVLRLSGSMLICFGGLVARQNT